MGKIWGGIWRYFSTDPRIWDVYWGRTLHWTLSAGLTCRDSSAILNGIVSSNEWWSKSFIYRNWKGNTFNIVKSPRCLFMTLNTLRCQVICRHSHVKRNRSINRSINQSMQICHWPSSGVAQVWWWHLELWWLNVAAYTRPKSLGVIIVRRRTVNNKETNGFADLASSRKLYFNDHNILCLVRNMIRLPRWYHIAIFEPAWWLLMAWRLFGGRTSATIMMT